MRPWARIAIGRGSKRHSPFLVITFTLLFVLGASCALVAYFGDRPVIVSAWDREVSLVTSARTVNEVLSEANIVLGPNDYCVPDSETPISQGMSVRVVRASIAFICDGGKTLAIETAKDTVGEVLSHASVVVGADDMVVPGSEEAVPENRQIKVVRVTYADVVEEDKIPYSTERRDDSSLEAGLVKTYRNGTEGIAKVTYTVKYEDGVEVSRQEVSRERVKDPSPQVVLVGSLRQVSRGGSDIRFRTAVEVLSTAYCPCAKCCGPNAKGVTSTGVPAERGVIAVDPRIIPLGSRVYVDGYGYATAADTGSAIKGNRVDVCFSTHDEALKWGMKRIKVYVID